MTDVDVAALGLPREVSSDLPVEHASKLAVTLDLPADVADGAALPLLWHWAYFTPEVPTAELGPDGHPVIPAGGPTEGLPRRMWAGGRVRSHAPLRLGRQAVRRSSVLRADHKAGRSGALLVVTLEHRILQAGELVRTEEQDLVYRAPDAGAPAPAGAPVELPAGDWSEARALDPVTLFRFSAVTFNSHRIHYDLPYATGFEGYPGLVVHGPLTAMLLFDAGQRRLAGEATSFEFRATAPLFAGTPFTVSGQGDEVRAVRADGVVSMSARIA